MRLDRHGVAIEEESIQRSVLVEIRLRFKKIEESYHVLLSHEKAKAHIFS
jgi:hypothetical protein